MTAKTLSLAFIATSLLWTQNADAHVAISSGPVGADSRAVINFGVGHGCAGQDTVSVRVEIPTGVTSVRALQSNLGPALVEKDQQGNVTAVTWAKPAADALDDDVLFYTMSIRVRVPDTAFSTLYFVATQTCDDPGGGNPTVVEWHDTPDTPVGEQTGEPAAPLVVVAEHRAGWNQFQVAAGMTDLETFFGDAQIVWKGNAAFSPNPFVAALIASTPGVTPLTSLAAGDEVEVKY